MGRWWWCSALASVGLGGVYNVQGLRGGRGVRVSAVCVYPVVGDGLGLRAHGMERHGQSSKVLRREGEELGLTIGVGVEWIAVQWRVVAV